MLAKRLVEAFGERTLAVIEQQPELLRQVKGISPQKADKIYEEFQHIHGLRAVMLNLSRFGISPSDAVKIWKRWGLSTQETIGKNPYELCCEEIGLPFQKADEIAGELEFDAESPERRSPEIEYVLRENLLSGHTCLPRDKLASVACQVLDCDVSLCEWAISRSIEEERLISCPLKRAGIRLPAALLPGRAQHRLPPLPHEAQRIRPGYRL